MLKIFDKNALIYLKENGFSKQQISIASEFVNCILLRKIKKVKRFEYYCSDETFCRVFVSLIFGIADKLCDNEPQDAMDAIDLFDLCLKICSESVSSFERFMCIFCLFLSEFNGDDSCDALTLSWYGRIDRIRISSINDKILKSDIYAYISYPLIRNGMIEEARILLLDCKKIREELFGANSLYVANIHHTLADICRIEGNVKDELILRRSECNICETCMNLLTSLDEYLIAAEGLFGMGNYRLRHQEYVEANEYLSRAKNLFEKCLAIDSSSVFRTNYLACLLNLAEIAMEVNGDLISAEHLLIDLAEERTACSLASKEYFILHVLKGRLRFLQDIPDAALDAFRYALKASALKNKANNNLEYSPYFAECLVHISLISQTPEKDVGFDLVKKAEILLANLNPKTEENLLTYIWLNEVIINIAIQKEQYEKVANAILGFWRRNLGGLEDLVVAAYCQLGMIMAHFELITIPFDFFCDKFISFARIPTFKDGNSYAKMTWLVNGFVCCYLQGRSDIYNELLNLILLEQRKLIGTLSRFSEYNDSRKLLYRYHVDIRNLLPIILSLDNVSKNNLIQFSLQNKTIGAAMTILSRKIYTSGELEKKANQLMQQIEEKHVGDKKKKSDYLGKFISELNDQKKGLWFEKIDLGMVNINNWDDIETETDVLKRKSWFEKALIQKTVSSTSNDFEKNILPRTAVIDYYVHPIAFDKGDSEVTEYIDIDRLVCSAVVYVKHKKNDSGLTVLKYNNIADYEFLTETIEKMKAELFAVKGTSDPSKVQNPENLYDHLRILYEILLKPFYEEISLCERIYVSTEYDLALVPFDSFPISPEEFLFDKHDVIFISNLSFFRRDEPLDFAKMKPLLMGIPTNGSLESEFSGVREELQYLSSIFHCKYYLGEEAQKKLIDNNDDITIFHYAGHSKIVTDNPEFQTRKAISYSDLYLSSSLPLADDSEITVEEIARLLFPNGKLAVISCCKTGYGPLDFFEGVVSFKNAFKIAGFETVIISIRPVEDPVAYDFMVEFYNNLKGGMDIGTAFSSAKRKRRRGGANLHDLCSFICTFG